MPPADPKAAPARPRRRFAWPDPRRSFGARLALAFGSMSLVFALGASLVVGQLIQRQIEDTITAWLSDLADEMAARLDRGVYDRLGDLRLVARRNALRDPQSPNARALLEGLQAVTPEFAWIGLLDPDGRVLVSTGGLLEGEDLSGRPVFIEGRKDLFVGDVHDAEALAGLLPPGPAGEPPRLVDLATPVWDLNGRPRGVLAAHLSWGWARQVRSALLGPSEVSRHVELTVLRQDGKLLLGPPDLPIDARPLELAGALGCRSDESQYQVERWPDGGTYLTASKRGGGYRDYPGLGWCVLVRQDADLAFAPARRIQQQILVWGAVLGAVFAGLAWPLARRVSSPLRAVAALAERVGRGDRSVTLAAPGERDEVGVLARSLTSLVGALTRRESELGALNTSLEQQVLALRESEQRYRQMFENNQAIKLLVDPESGAIVDANAAACSFYGYPPEELRRKRMTQINTLPPEQVAAEMARAVANERSSFVFRHRLAGGEIRDVEVHSSPVDVRGRRLLYSIIHDITERQRAEDALRHQALHDQLTELPNRSLLHERLQQAIAAAGGGSAALLVLDLDRFKEVNDAFGHHRGDRLLRQVGQRLRAVVDDAGTVARLGGDEFAVLLPGAGAREATRVAQELLGALEQPLELDGTSLDLGASIGIAVCPEHGADADTLLRRADVAMYVAKRGRHRYALYTAHQGEHSPGALALIGELRRAIEGDLLALHYQPKVDFAGGLAGVEALVRWRHPRRGSISPEELVRLAEHTGLIKPLTGWVLDTAIRQCQAWAAANRAFPVAVNVSMYDLHDGSLPDLIAELLAARRVTADCLRLEITESAIMADVSQTMEVLERLRALGVGVAVDDFGTGYSSLAYLRRLPVDELKIDRSFVRQLGRSEEDAAIVRSTIGLGHDLGLTVVAEGIEDQAAWELLERFGCDLAQGYFVSPALPVAELAGWLAASGGRRLARAGKTGLARA